jgi:hypothetical protein
MGVGTLNKGAQLVSLKDGSVRQLPDNPPSGQFGSGLIFSSDGRLVAGDRWEVQESGIRVWDLESDSVRVLEKSRGMTIWAYAFPEEGSLFTGDYEGNLLRWNVKDGSSTLVEKSQYPAIQQLEALRDSRFLLALWASSSNLGPSWTTQLKLFDLENHTSRLITTRGNKVSGFALDSTRALLVTTSEDGAVCVGPLSGENPHILPTRGAVWWPSVSPDGRWIVAAIERAAKPTYCLWRMPQGRPIQTLPHDEFLNYLCSRTNFRVVPDKTSNTDYRVDKAPFPGWGKIPAE